MSLTLTLPLLACNVNADALTTTVVGDPIEPLSLTSTTAAALPVAPAIPVVPELTIDPLVPVAVVCKKNVPVLLTVDGAIVTALAAASDMNEEPLLAVTVICDAFTARVLPQSVPMLPVLVRLACVPVTVPVPLIPPVVVVSATEFPLTPLRMFRVPALTV